MWQELLTPLSNLLPTIVVVAGWVWQLSAKTSRIGALEDRIAKLEVALTAGNERIDDINERLARMEASLAIIVGKVM